jgi:hypothetical protein
MCQAEIGAHHEEPNRRQATPAETERRSLEHHKVGETKWACGRCIHKG